MFLPLLRKPVTGLVVLLIGCLGAACWGAGEVELDKLPHFASGVRMYPTPFLAVARSPGVIASPQGGGMNIQSDVGFLSGFSGFVDEATGQFGFPGYRNHSIANFAFDNEKLVIQAHVPYPEGRKLRAHQQQEDLSGDDVFELLIEPRDHNGATRGRVYRITGNALGVWQADFDEPGIGQFHRTWESKLRYGSMLWDPTGGWMASVAIPWDSLGGRPDDGDVWGVQFAVRYADPKIVAVLSPTERFTDVSRFARIRFDFNRTLNYRAHWMTEEMKSRWFSVGYLLANGGSTPQTVKVTAMVYKGDKAMGSGEFEKTCPPGASYWMDGKKGDVTLESHPASQEERDTVAHVVVYDHSQNDAVIYDQWIPYWQPVPGERDWLKKRFGNDFTLNIGPYPSLGVMDYAIDAQTLCEVHPEATRLNCRVLADGKEVFRDDRAMPHEGRLGGSVKLGAFTDGVTYQLVATISDGQDHALATRTESFTRHVMPFEKAPPAGLEDVVLPPFTAPEIRGQSVSCWGRTYEHGADGLFEHLIAADQDLLSGPAAFRAVLNDGSVVTLKGGAVTLAAKGKRSATYQQTFTGGGLTLHIEGDFDYDGFYHFRATFAPQNQPVGLKELRLEVPIQPTHATLIDAAVSWMYPGWEKSLGFLGTQNGRVWDSHTLPYQEGDRRRSNMPPYLWVGDDDRGLCFSQASDQGTHNDLKLPAAALDRTDHAVTMTIWLVNKPLDLQTERSVEFAFQASPFKPMPADARLWRNQPRAGGTYQHGVYFTNFWTNGAYPTYGRWLTLDYLKKQVEGNGCDRSGMMASALSECAGTPEYRQFYYEWGSGMDEYKRFIEPVPTDIMTRFNESGQADNANPFVMVEAFSNTVRSNRDYRAWWLSQAAQHAGISFIYQDNATWVYTDRPAPQYGYQREDGTIEPTSMIWKSRLMMKRFATAIAASGQPAQPAVWPNMISPVVPGRAFCGKALTGEYTNSDQLRMGMMRVHLSKQWGMVTDWLCQGPASAGSHIGATRKYWRALFSEILLMDVTNFSRGDSADIARRWFNALDLFWLDDPTVRWHPYYRNPTLASVEHPDSTFVSSYTASGRMLAVVSNRDTKAVVESIRMKDLGRFDCGEVRYFYDAETGEEIDVSPDGAWRLFIPGHDYRLVIGFAQPWKFAARNTLEHPDEIPPQSEIDADATLSAICKNLLTSRTLPPMPDAHRLTEAFARRILQRLSNDTDVVYLDAKATADIDLGDPAIRCAAIYDRASDGLFIAYYNDTDHPCHISTSVRDQLSQRVGKTSYNYVYDAISGSSQWQEIEMPAHSGRWEVCYSNAQEYYGPRRGVLGQGTWMSNILQAVSARKAEMEKP